jgi:hypothetical protein
VVGTTEAHDAVPVTLHETGEFLERLEALPLERLLPTEEELHGFLFGLALPQEIELLPEEVGGVETLVRLEEKPECFLARLREAVGVTEEVVPLPFDEAAVGTSDTLVLAATNIIHGGTQMGEDVELVVDDGGVRRVPFGRGAERLPHVHGGVTDLLRLLLPEEGIELIHTRLAPVLASEPDGAAAHEVGDDDPVLMALANGDLVNTDGNGSRCSGSPELLLHVLLIELLHRLPVEVCLLGHILDGGGPAASPDEEGEPLRVEGVVRQPVELFAFHSTAVATGNSANLHLEVHAPISAGEITNPAPALVVVGLVPRPTDTAGCFFRRRDRVTTTALGSPKMPQTSGLERKPGNV